jgi:hypothetical protein
VGGPFEPAGLTRNWWQRCLDFGESWVAKASRISDRLRSLALQKGFALELTVQGTRVRLIDEGIGQAMKDVERGLALFSARDAVCLPCRLPAAGRAIRLISCR